MLAALDPEDDKSGGNRDGESEGDEDPTGYCPLPCPADSVAAGEGEAAKQADAGAGGVRKPRCGGEGVGDWGLKGARGVPESEGGIRGGAAFTSRCAGTRPAWENRVLVCRSGFGLL